MKSAFRITAKLTPGTAARLELIKEWPERLQHVQPMMPYLAAHYVLNYVRTKIPKGSAYRSYRQGLEVARVRGGDKGESAYVVHVNMKSRLIRKVKTHATLMYVHVKERQARTDPATKILEKYNPWTFESLPFTPKPQLGYVRTKKSRPAIVAETTQKRMKQRPKWARELARVGYRVGGNSKRLKIPKKAQVLPNVALEALKMEFGLGGAKPRPAWRVGVRRLIKSELRRMSKNPKYFVFPLTKLSDKVWAKWPLRTKTTIPESQALKYVPFQRKLGIRP